MTMNVRGMFHKVDAKLRGCRGKRSRRRLLRSIYTCGRAVLAAFILISLILNGANIAARYIFLSPIVWVEEVMIFLMIWSVFIGAGLVAGERRHLKMDIVSGLLTGVWRRAANVLVAAITIAASVYATGPAYEVTRMMLVSGQRGLASGTPMVLAHLAVLVGLILIALCTLLNLPDAIAGEDTDDKTPLIGGNKVGDDSIGDDLNYSADGNHGAQ